MKSYTAALEDIPYSGGGIILGMTPDKDIFLAYSLTGRTESGQVRTLEKGENTNTVRTEVKDMQLRKSSSDLLLYRALIPIITNQRVNGMVAGNGAQTKVVFNNYFRTSDVKPNHLMKEAFANPFFEYDPDEDRRIDLTSYEPDKSTPRITAYVFQNLTTMHIVRRQGDKTVNDIFNYEFYEGDTESFDRIKSNNLLKDKAEPITPGTGKLLTTYKSGNESLLLPFDGKPIDVVVGSTTADEIVKNIYASICHGSKPDENFAVAAAGMLLKQDGTLDVKVKNRHKSEETDGIYAVLDSYIKENQQGN